LVELRLLKPKLTERRVHFCELKAALSVLLVNLPSSLKQLPRKSVVGRIFILLTGVFTLSTFTIFVSVLLLLPLIVGGSLLLLLLLLRCLCARVKRLALSADLLEQRITVLP
jgi:hypothetical protein